MLQRFISAIGRMWNSGRNGKIAVGVGVFIVACLGCAAVGAIIGPQQPRQVAQATSGPAPAAAAEPTAAPVATEAPTVVPTEAPTNTPEPTAVPTNTPEPTAVPEPVVLSGTGQDVTDKFTLPSPVSKLVITHQGRRNFVVTLYRETGRPDLLVNTIGNYAGTRLAATTESIYLEIKADGAWKIEVVPIGMNDAHGAAFEGKGDGVSDLFTPASTGPVPYEFSHDGQRNFIVQLHCAGGTDVVQNAIGAVSGAAVVNLSRGPCAWEVQADGAWTIRTR